MFQEPLQRSQSSSAAVLVKEKAKTDDEARVIVWHVVGSLVRLSRQDSNNSVRRINEV